MSKEVRPFNFILCYQSSTGDKYWVLRKMLLAVVMSCCAAERIAHTVHLLSPMLSWGKKKKKVNGVATFIFKNVTYSNERGNSSGTTEKSLNLYVAQIRCECIDRMDRFCVKKKKIVSRIFFFCPIKECLLHTLLLILLIIGYYNKMYILPIGASVYGSFWKSLKAFQFCSL